MVRGFKKLMENRGGTYHLVDQRGRRIVRRQTRSWVYGTLLDYRDKLVLFEDPARLAATTLEVLLPASEWVSDMDKIPNRDCPCELSQCQGQLTVIITNDSPGPEWTLEISE